MQLCNWKIEPEAINTAKNQLTCLRIAFWKRDLPIFEKESFDEEPQRYCFEYEKTLEPKLIEAIKQSEILTVIIENQKIVQIK
jgi:hypothetical protein